MASIFISYRRGRTNDITYRIHERLAAHFGVGNVYIDIDNIPIGVRFPDHLANTLDTCDVVLAVIGHDWQPSRLKDEGDVLRQELEFALERNVVLVPLLVHGAAFPRADELPDSLFALLEFQALEVDSGRDFTSNVSELIRGIERSLEEAALARARGAEERALRQRQEAELAQRGAVSEAVWQAAHSPAEGLRLGAAHELIELLAKAPTGSARNLLAMLSNDPSPRVARYAQSGLGLQPVPQADARAEAASARPRTVTEPMVSVPAVSSTEIPEFRSNRRQQLAIVLATGGGGVILLSLALWLATRSDGIPVVSSEPRSESKDSRAGASIEAKTDPLGIAASGATPVASPSAGTRNEHPDGGPAMTPDGGPETTPGHGQLGGSHKVLAPKVGTGATTVIGSLPTEVIRRIVRRNYGSLRACYERGLGRNPNLQGRVSVRFVIGRDGSVSNVSNGGSDLPDSGVVSCVISAFYGLSFPQPEGGGIVTVVYPILLTPG